MNINENIIKKFNSLQEEVMLHYNLEKHLYGAEFHHRAKKYNIYAISIVGIGYDTSRIGRLDYDSLRGIVKFLDEKYPYLVPFYTFTVYFMYPHIDLQLIVDNSIFAEMNTCVENVRKEIKKKELKDFWDELFIKKGVKI